MHYLSRFTWLVELERQAEIRQHQDEISRLSAQERKALGRCEYELKGHKADNVFHYTVVKFNKFGEKAFNAKFTTGDLVLVSKGNPNDSDLSGTVLEVNRFMIKVAFEAKVPKWVFSGNIRLDLYANDITFQRMLNNLKSFIYQKHPLKELILGERKPFITKPVDIDPFNENLNSSQLSAVSQSLGTRDIFLIHGPPGTGKTTTLAEAIYQATLRGKKVLVTAESNIAADNILSKLDQYPALDIVRVGHPARIIKGLEKYSLFHQFQEHPKSIEIKICKDQMLYHRHKQKKHQKPLSNIRRGLKEHEIQSLARKGKSNRGINRKTIQSMYEWLKMNKKVEQSQSELRDLEEEVFQEIISAAQVVVCTNSTAASHLMEKHYFDLSVIDEGSQQIEPSTLIPLLKSRRAIIAGDDQQLPPTILSQKAQPLSFSFFERFKKAHSENCVMLDIQYRMNDQILKFPRFKFYNNQLQSAPSVSHHSLQELLKTKPSESYLDSHEAVSFLDTSKINDETSIEIRGKKHTSYENEYEAETTLEIIKSLLKHGLKQKQLGIISPYQGQVRRLRKQLEEDREPIEDIEVNSIDGFQGREKEVIILSLVRANEDGQIGFSSDLRRLNVAITRARRKLIIIGHGSTLKHHPVYAEWLESI